LEISQLVVDQQKLLYLYVLFAFIAGIIFAGIAISVSSGEMMVKEFNDVCFNNETNDVIKVETQYGVHLIKITKGTKLMGCVCIVSGISPAIAQTLVNLGIDLGDVITTSTLRDALEIAFDNSGLEVRKK